MSSMLVTARGRAAAAAAAAAIAAAAALALYIRSRSRADLALDVDDQPVRSVLDTVRACMLITVDGAFAASDVLRQQHVRTIIVRLYPSLRSDLGSANGHGTLDSLLSSTRPC
eukprot:6200717-Pleurochrysis_carterae.AAC.1